MVPKKQYCESNAAKRFIKNFNKAHPRQKFMICGDGLRSHQPMIEVTLDKGLHYLFVAKPERTRSRFSLGDK